MNALLRFVFLRDLRRHAARTLLTLACIALGVALFVATRITNRSAIASLERASAALRSGADLVVSSASSILDEKTLKTVESIEGVEAASPLVVLTAATPSLPRDRWVAVLGVDAEREKRLRSYEFVEAGERFEVPEAYAKRGFTPLQLAVTSESFACRNGLEVGRRFEIVGKEGRHELEVIGLLADGASVSAAYGGAICLMPLRAVQWIFGLNGGFNRIDVRVVRGVDPVEVGRRLKAVLPAAAAIEGAADRGRVAERAYAAYETFLGIVGWLALVVAAFLVYNSASVSVFERERCLGIVRALGARSRRVASAFLAEAAVEGVAGSAAGVVLGIGLARLLVVVVSSGIAVAGPTTGGAALQIAGSDLIVAFLAGTGAAVAGAALPTVAACRVATLDVLRRRALGPRAARAAPVLSLAGLGAVAAGAWLSRDTLGSRSAAGAIAAVLLMVGLAVATPGIVFILARALSAVVRRTALIEARLASDGVMRSPRRTALTVLAFMLSLSLFVGVTTLASSWEGSISRWARTAFAGDLIVTASDNVANAMSGVPIREEVGARIRAVAGVASIAAVRYALVPFEGDDVMLMAVDFRERAAGEGLVVVQGDSGGLIDALVAGDVAVNESLRNVHGLGVGDAFELETATGPRRLRIAAVIADFSWPGALVALDRATYKSLRPDPLVSRFEVWTSPGTDAATVKRAIEGSVLLDEGLICWSQSEFRERFLRLFRGSFATAHAQEGAALVIGVLSVINTLVISVIHRRREIGLLRAVGAKAAQVGCVVAWEAALIGVFSIVIGVPAGWMIAMIARSIAYSQTGYYVVLEFPALAVCAASAAGLGVAALSAWFPARRAARLDVLDAIGFE